MTGSPARTKLTAIWIAHAVKSIEESGPLEDDQAMAQSFSRCTGTQDRLLERAWILGERLGLDRQIARLKTLQWIFGISFCFLAYFTSGGLIAPFSGPDRSINAVIALATVLLVPTAVLLLWVAAAARLLLWPGRTGAYAAGSAFGSLLAWIPARQAPHTRFLIRGGLDLLRTHRLAPWVFGLMGHALWSVVLVAVLATLLFLFHFQQYTLDWRTTTGSQASFDAFVRLTGTVPGLLGFDMPLPVPLNARPSPAQSSAAAWWLIGCTFTYGLLPRLFALAVCWLALRRRIGALHVDTSDPYYRKLVSRFDAMEATSSEDPEVPSDLGVQATPAQPAPDGQAALVLVGFELAQDLPFPPAQLGDRADLVRQISGGFDDRRAVLNELARMRPRQALVLCDADASPDRGTGRFLREVSSYAGQVGVLLTTPRQGDGGGPARWSDWLATLELANLRCIDSEPQAQRWIDETHGKTH